MLEWSESWYFEGVFHLINSLNVTCPMRCGLMQTDLITAKWLYGGILNEYMPCDLWYKCGFDFVSLPPPQNVHEHPTPFFSIGKSAISQTVVCYHSWQLLLPTKKWNALLTQNLRDKEFHLLTTLLVYTYVCMYLTWLIHSVKTCECCAQVRTCARIIFMPDCLEACMGG